MEIDVAGKLFPNITTIIVQLLATGFMLLLFKRFFWKPMQDYLAKRADFIEDTINSAKNMQQEAINFIEESESQSRKAANEYSNIIKQAKIEAMKVKDTILSDAAKEVELEAKQAKKEIEATKIVAKQQMKEEIVTIAMEAANKVVSEQIDEKRNKALIIKFLEEAEK